MSPLDSICKVGFEVNSAENVRRDFVDEESDFDHVVIAIDHSLCCFTRGLVRFLQLTIASEESFFALISNRPHDAGIANGNEALGLLEREGNGRENVGALYVCVGFLLAGPDEAA